MLGEEDLRTPREIEQDECKSYYLEFYEKQSLDEIENLLDSGLYHSVHKVHEHLEFLEHLLFKLSNIRMQEFNEGISTAELDDAITKINKLIRRLMGLIYVLESNSQYLVTHKFKYA